MSARSEQYLRTLTETGLPHVSQRPGPYRPETGQGELVSLVLPSLEPHQRQKHRQGDPGRPKLR